MNYASLFTGGGLADWGARAAGLTPVWGVEYDPAIAAVAQRNDDTGTVYAADVCAVDYAALPRVDVLHASPPCPNFSVAKTGRGETAHDLALADAVVRAITAQRPALFTLENVRGYAQSQSLARITAALLDLDYHVTTAIVNAADHGVPQTRERLFLFAHAGGWMQAARPLPAPTPWRGWYDAIADLLPTLPASSFAPWQLARLPELTGEETLLVQRQPGARGDSRRVDEPAKTVASTDPAIRAFIVHGTSTMEVRGADEPSAAVVATVHSKAARPRAWLVSTHTERGDAPPLRATEEPAHVVGTNAARLRARLDAGRVVAMTPRALARFQSVPDAYVLPERASLACRIIGNGVAVEAYRRLLESQLWT